MAAMPDNSVDSIVCDPPYEIDFMGKGWDRSGIAYDPVVWQQCLRVLRPGGHMVAASHVKTYHRMAIAIEDSGFEIRDMIPWIYSSGFPKNHDAERAVAQKQCVLPGRHFSRQVPEGAKFMEGDHICHETADSLIWKGFGTALKPANEPFCLARKPLDGSVAENILKWGVGVLNIDDCRVGDDEAERGRWPANIITDGSEPITSQFPEVAAGGGLTGNEPSRPMGGHVYGDMNGRHTWQSYDDFGSAARFFYCAKSSTEDREHGLEMLEHQLPAAAQFRPNHLEKANDGEAGNPYGRYRKRKNIHPTVKPVGLMRYLCRLITPRGGTVLDPFMGSGSTGKAARHEIFKFIGIDITPEYYEIATRRLSAVVAQMDLFRHVKPQAQQPSMFGDE